MDQRPEKRILLAYDQDELTPAGFKMLCSLAPYIGGIKTGIETSTAEVHVGPYATVTSEILSRAPNLNLKIFVDEKFYGIPNAVGTAVRNMARHKVWGQTVAVDAGPESVKAAVENCNGSLIVGVTLLTSINRKDCLRMHCREPEAQVVELAQILVEQKAHAIVSAGDELEAVIKKTGNALIRITPGIREKGARHHDQERTITAYDAIKAGAHYLAIGRPITEATDPLAATQVFVEQIARADANRSMI